MQADEIRELSEEDIRARIAELEEERFRLRFRAGTETLEDPLRQRVIRRNVARLKTVLNEKIIGIAGSGTPAALPKTKDRAKGAKKRAGRRTATGATRSSKRA